MQSAQAQGAQDETAAAVLASLGLHIGDRLEVLWDVIQPDVGDGPGDTAEAGEDGMEPAIVVDDSGDGAQMEGNKPASEREPAPGDAVDAPDAGDDLEPASAVVRRPGCTPGCRPIHRQLTAMVRPVVGVHAAWMRWIDERGRPVGAAGLLPGVRRARGLSLAADASHLYRTARADRA